MAITKLTQLYETKNYVQLEEAVNEISSEQLIAIIDENIPSLLKDNTGNILTIFKAILLGCGSSGSKHSLAFLHLYKESIKVLESNAPSSLLTEFACILNCEANNLTTGCISELCSILLGKVKDGCVGLRLCLKLFQKLLDVVKQHTSVEVDNLKGIVCGSEYKHFIIGELCSYKWRRESIIPIIDMIKELNPTTSESDEVVAKLMDEINQIEPDELPAFVFQLLGFSSVCSKVQPILYKMIDHFNKLAKQAHASRPTDDDQLETTSCAAEARLVALEGTILLYFSNCLKQNQALGKSLLKMLKSTKSSLPPDTLSTFFLALNLVLVQDSRFKEETLFLLRSLVFKCLQDDQKIKSSKYLKLLAAPPPNIEELLLHTVRNCTKGWESIGNGIVDLSFHLMAFYGPKQGPFNKSFPRESGARSSPQDVACCVGSRVLALAFKVHEATRSKIVAELLKRIQISAGSPAFHYIGLLASITKFYPQALLQYNSLIKITLDYLALMKPHNVRKLLPALLPLLKSSSSLRNSLVLVLRKSLSSRETDARLSALLGFLLILKNFPLSEVTTLSQVSSQSSQSIFSSQPSSSLGSPGNAHNRMLCMEILQALKRCLLQQCFIRVELYQGMYDVIVRNPRLAPLVVETALVHFRTYYETDDDILPPIATSRCLSKLGGDVQEPLHLLISLLHHAVRLSMLNAESDKDEDEPVLEQDLVDRMKGILKSITERLCKSEPEDFAIESSSTSGDQAPVLVLATYQAVIGYNCTVFLHTNEGSERIVSLYEFFKKLLASHFGGKLPHLLDKNSAGALMCSCSISTLSDVVKVLLREDDVGRQLASHEGLTKHVMSLLLATLQHGRDNGYFLGIAGSNKSESIAAVKEAAEACFHKFMVEKNATDRSPVTLLCLECFHVALQYFQTRGGKNIGGILSSLCSEGATQPQSHEDVSSKPIKRFWGMLVSSILQPWRCANHMPTTTVAPEFVDNIALVQCRLQRIVMSFFAADNPLSANERKVVTELLSVLDSLAAMATSGTMEEASDWWRKLCAENHTDDVACVKRAVGSHLQASSASSLHPEIPFRDVASDIHSAMGSIEGMEDSEASATYRLITEGNAHHLVPLLMTHLDRVISDVEWLLQYLKGSCVVDQEESNDEEEKRRKIENSICVTVCTIGVGLLDLASTSTNHASSVDVIIAGLASVFTFLTHLSKYYLWLHSQRKRAVPARYEKLVSFVGADLMRPIYSFIMHAQNVQCAGGRNDAGKKTKKSNQSVSSSGKAKVVRESKGVARLVFAIEQHEHNLIVLAARTKIDFMSSFHLPTSRDFRIRSDVVRMTVTEQEASKEDPTEGGDDEPNQKRARLDS